MGDGRWGGGSGVAVVSVVDLQKLWGGGRQASLARCATVCPAKQKRNGLPGRPSKNATAKKEIEPSEIEPSEIEPSEIEPSCFPTYQKTVRVAQGDLVRDASGTLRVRDRRDFLVW